MTAELTRSYGTIIVGAGHAGSQAAASLLAGGYEAGIAVLSNETSLPYDRPSLSKAYLLGESEFDDILLRPSEFWNSPGLELILGAEAAAIDPAQRVVELHDGRRFGYESLIWAAGGTARRLTIPGSDLAGVHSVRGFGDTERLRNEAQDAASAVIVGGGYIGLESTAALRASNVDVTVIEVADRLLARVTGPVVAEHFQQQHRAAGVEFRMAASVIELLPRAGSDRVGSVLLGTGEAVPADVVIVGVGLLPSISPIAAAGADVSNGIDVDANCRTSLPHVYAVGDCANFPIALYEGRSVRLESVQNAVDQAKIAAADILGEDVSYDPVPWFWSHQYDVRFQTVGLLNGYDDEVVRGDPASGHFSIVYLKDSVVLAVDAVNSPKEFAQAKKLVGHTLLASRDELADASTSLKDLRIDDRQHVDVSG